MSDAERIWSEKSDEDLLDAAAALDEFTEEGQRVIRAELKRRGLEDPVEQAIEEGDEAGREAEVQAEVEVLECLRCREPLVWLQAPESEPVQLQWRGEPFPAGSPALRLQAYACRRCGHVELFTDLREADQEEG